MQEMKQNLKAFLSLGCLFKMPIKKLPEGSLFISLFLIFRKFCVGVHFLYIIQVF